MGSPSWTDEQNEVINAKGCSLLVSAAAGAGKTAVLVERIIRKITADNNPVDVDRLLVVTFTKAAAAEMRERISAAIVRELNNNPECSHLKRQLALLNRASITTLHSFCLEVLRQYFYRLDLDPVFRVADATEATLLKLETLEELLEELYGSDHSDFITLVDSYGGDRDDSALQDLVLRLYEFSVSNPWPDKWLSKIAANYEVGEGLPLGSLPWAQTILQWAELQLQGCRTKLDRAMGLAASIGGPAPYIDNLKADISLIDSLLNSVNISWENFYKAAGDIFFGNLKRCGKDVDDTLKDRVKKIRDGVKKTVNGIRDAYFLRPPKELAADLNQVAPLVKTLVELTAEFSQRYTKAKSDKGLVDFSDLEHYALKILLDETAGPGMVAASTAACDLREYFEEVLVDEYQDINEVQETILQLVSKDGTVLPNRFMVGDVKQSIYRFRLADPQLFMEKYRSYPREKGSAERAIDLTKNFRSRGEVVDAVNFVFRQLMTPRVGELIYDEKAELVCGALFPPAGDSLITAAGPTELHILEKQTDIQDTGPDWAESDDENQGQQEAADEGFSGVGAEDLNAVQREARFIARRIRQMVNGREELPGPEFSVLDKKAGGYRPVQYNDIVILLRATRSTANTFIEELRLEGVPAYADLDTGYFEATEIETMLALLRVVDNPRQDIPLAGVLRSPIVGLNAQDLASVRLRTATGDYYDAVKKSAQLGETPADLKLRWFLENLEKWRTMARRGPLSELVWRLYNETGFYAYVGGMPGGSQRQANLRALYDRARQYEATTFRGLFRFLRFIEKFRASGSDMGAARSVGEAENVVRVISIHKSKGLEFPVVIAAGLGRQFNTQDLKQKYLFHKELGLGLPVVDLNIRLSYPTIAQGAIIRRLHMEMLAEEMRVLYVAVTRAREKLILVGSVKDIPKHARLWCDNSAHPHWPLPDADLAGAQCFLDWISPAVARHKEGEPLRQLANVEAQPAAVTAADTSSWQVNFWGPSGDELQAPEKQTDESEFIDLVRNLAPVNIAPVSGNLEDLLNWQYPQLAAVGKPAKASVTELKHIFSPRSEEGFETEMAPELRPTYSSSALRPQFLMNVTGLSPSERGSAMHLVMQHLDPRCEHTDTGVAEKLREMVAREILTSSQAQSIDIQAITGFYKSPLGKKLRDAPDVRQELPFTMVIPASRIYSEITGEENILVQGVIDCLIEEDNGFVIIDYKTDRVTAGQENEILQRYSGQLDLYALAVETILQKPVREKYLYLFSLGREVKCG